MLRHQQVALDDGAAGVRRELAADQLARSCGFQLGEVHTCAGPRRAAAEGAGSRLGHVQQLHRQARTRPVPGRLRLRLHRFDVAASRHGRWRLAIRIRRVREVRVGEGVGIGARTSRLRGSGLAGLRRRGRRSAARSGRARLGIHRTDRGAALGDVGSDEHLAAEQQRERESVPKLVTRKVLERIAVMASPARRSLCPLPACRPVPTMASVLVTQIRWSMLAVQGRAKLHQAPPTSSNRRSRYARSALLLTSASASR